MINSIIKCGEGWKSLYSSVINKIIEHDSNQFDVKFKIGIKSVYDMDGALCFDVINPNNLTKEIVDIINDAHKKSLTICSFCGADKDIGTTMNCKYITCCKTCWQEKILPNNPKSIWKSYETNKFYKKIS